MQSLVSGTTFGLNLAMSLYFVLVFMELKELMYVVNATDIQIYAWNGHRCLPKTEVFQT